MNATVGTTASKVFILPPGTGYTAVQFSNTHTSAMFLGASSSVSASGANHGLLLAANSNSQVWMRGGDEIWAIASVASGTGDLAILYSGV